MAVRDRSPPVRDRFGRTSGYGNDGRKTQFSRKSMSTAESEPRLSRAVIGFGMANSAQRTLSLGRWLAADDPLTTLDQAPPMSDIGRRTNPLRGRDVAALVRMIPAAINEHHPASKARALPWTRKGQLALDPWGACGAR